MPKGGKQPGAGRPKGTRNPETIDKAMAREALRAIVLKHMDALVSAQISHAKGLNYLVARDKTTGKFEKLTQADAEALLAGEESKYTALEVWQKDPSVAAFTDLMNRALDKPIEPQEVQHTGTLHVQVSAPWLSKS